LSEWVKAIRSLIVHRIHKLKFCVNTRLSSVFKDKRSNEWLSSIHDKYVVVPDDKAYKHIVFVFKKYYYVCLIKELDISKKCINPTYKPNILVWTRNIFLQITSHLCHLWMFRLIRKIMTYFILNTKTSQESI